MPTKQAAIDDDVTLGQLAVERPDRIRLLEGLHLDYCCGGSSSLRDACQERGLDLDAVRAQLEAADREEPAAEPAVERDWRQAPFDELCAHIAQTHHDYLRHEMPRIAVLLATVVRVHGADCLDFELIERTFASLQRVLGEHIDEEEQILFPACVALERGGAGATDLDRATLEAHRTEHEAVGRKLEALRLLAGEYDRTQALCSTHGATLDALREFEADLHRHVHLENNVLLPRAAALLDDAAGPAATPAESDARP